MIKDIILNEKKYVENIFEHGDNGDSYYRQLYFIARYCYHVYGYRFQRISKFLRKFTEEHFHDYIKELDFWYDHDNDIIGRIARQAGKYPLSEVDSVTITEAEMQTVQSLEGKRLQRLAFTLLCLAKLGIAKNPKRDGWVSNEQSEIFRLAHMQIKEIDQCCLISQLYELKLVDFPKRNDNTSIKVLYVNNDSKPVLEISDFRELGYEYLLYCGEPYIRCKKCGRLTRKTNAKKYCAKCASKEPMVEKQIRCADCGDLFTIVSRNNQTKRCPYCQAEHKKMLDRERAAKYRAAQKTISESA